MRVRSFSLHDEVRRREGDRRRPGRSAVRALVATAFVTFAAACSGSSDGSAGPISLDDYPDAAAAALCDALAPCCGSIGIAIDAATCRAMMSGSIRQDIQDAPPANYTYDPDAAGACVSEFRVAFAGCEPTTLQLGSCDAAFQGNLAEGAVCTADFECASSGDGQADCDFGNCVVDRRGQAGDPCYWSCHEEGTATSCSGSGGEELPGQARCFDNDGLYCGGGTCTEQKQNGVDCGSDRECTSDRCDAGLCVPKGSAGQACFFDSDCEDDLYCDAGGSCVQSRADGASCAADEECQSNNCSGTTCAARPTLNGSPMALACAIAGGGLSLP